ncbi:S41 family peptidase [Amedibacillus sp. YH-ame6]
MAEKNVKRYKLVKHKWPDEIKAQRDRRIKIIAIVFFCIACFCAGFLVNNFTSTKVVSEDQTFAKLSTVYEIMKDKFYFGVDKKDFEETLIDGAISGMVNAGGDSHTSYMTPKTAKDFTSSMSGSYVGIGIQYYEVGSNTFLVDKVFKNSPAEEAGIVAGDIIYAVNGTLCENMDSDEVKEMISGKSGTKVKVEIIHNNEHVMKEVERREVSKTVTSSLQGDVAIIELSTFADTSGDEFGNHLKDLSKKAKSLVIDLRNNGGGYLTAAQQIASYLLPENSVVFKEKQRNGDIDEYKVLEDTKRYAFEQIIVLVNEDTASASEVLAMALKENLNAKVVGTKTYGKGTIQVPMPFKDSSQLKYTTAKWLSPNEKSVDKKGITPDVEVNLDPAITTSSPVLEKDEVFKADTVNIAAKSVQTYLKFLGYTVDRTDEYFSPASSNALKAFQKDNGLEVTGEINEKVISTLISQASLKWHSDASYDTQLAKAVELANGK